MKLCVCVCGENMNNGWQVQIMQMKASGRVLIRAAFKQTI